MASASQSALTADPNSVNDASFTKFFQAFRSGESASAERLGNFLRQFEESFRKARVKRIRTTPHMNLLRVFGLECAELRHSDVLAWFLDPRAEHEQGKLFANALLAHLGSQPLPDENYQVVREQHGRTDVALYAKMQSAVFIENKVRHSETAGQVSGMVDALVQLGQQFGIPPERRFALFLTDAGTSATTGPKRDSPEFALKNLRSLSRIEVFELFRDELLAQPRFSPLLRCFLDSYLDSIGHLHSRLLRT